LSRKLQTRRPRLCLHGTEQQEIGINAGLKVGEVLVGLSYSTILFVGFSRGLACLTHGSPFLTCSLYVPHSWKLLGFQFASTLNMPGGFESQIRFPQAVLFRMRRF